MPTFSYPLSSQFLEFFTMIRQEVSNFSSFSRCLEIYPESSLSLTEYVAHFLKHPMYLISLPSGVMPRVSTALHLPVTFDDITGQLANCNEKCKFSTCPYNVLQDFTVDSEVTKTSHSKIARKLHAWCTCPDRVLKRRLPLPKS